MRWRRRDLSAWERRHVEFEQRCFAAFLPALQAVGLDPGVEGASPGVSGTTPRIGAFNVLLFEGDIDTGESSPGDRSGEVWLTYDENTGKVSVSLLGDRAGFEGWAPNEHQAMEQFERGLRPLLWAE